MVKVVEILRSWADEGRLAISLQDIAAHVSSSSHMYFIRDKLVGQGILKEINGNKRRKFYQINWDIVIDWYPELADVVGKLLDELDKRRVVAMLNPSEEMKSEVKQ